jgi:hypothetical protein
MKILYISGGVSPDYQCDMLFDGLRTVLGTDVVDVNRLSYMYRADGQASLVSLYGRGFTLYGRLPDEKVDRADIRHKIATRYFDFIVYGSVWRNLDYYSLVRSVYNHDRIAFIDGEDEQMLRRDVIGCGLYFKRECTRHLREAIPINFAIPARAVRSTTMPKDRVLATVIPSVSQTYIFDDEQQYFDDYAVSRYAITQKKAGWDCLRHYEIMANGCLPLFQYVRLCPSHSLISLPKAFLRKISGFFPEPALPLEESFEACRAYTAARLTTQVLAEWFIEALYKQRRPLPDTRLLPFMSPAAARALSGSQSNV